MQRPIRFDKEGDLSACTDRNRKLLPNFRVTQIKIKRKFKDPCLDVINLNDYIH